MIIGTAGHIDHGKTTLVRALTGVDTDRLPAEKARGITIELGFAYWPRPDGAIVGFVDVPGHERLVHTMLAGATGIDAVLLIVAADDGVMPQTSEHLAIVDLLGLEGGIVALTKCDLVDAARLDAVRGEIRAALAGTGLADAQILPVSARTGAGLDGLAAALDALRRTRAGRADDGRFRLAIDRVFTLAGAGTVVTGTVLSGMVALGDPVTVSPPGLAGRVRSIHAQNRAVTQGRAGQRCAIAIHGPRIDRDAVPRGAVLLDPGLHAPTQRLDARLRVLAGEPRGLSQWQPVRLHHGATEIAARLVLLREGELAPGADDFVQLVLDAPLAAAVGDRFILRDTAATRTLGGGVIVDLRPPERRRRTPARRSELAALAVPDPAAALAAFLAGPRGWIDLDAFARDRALAADQPARLAAAAGLVTLTGGGMTAALAPARWGRLVETLEAMLDQFHAEQPDQPGLGQERLRLALDPRLPAPLFAAALARLRAAGVLVLDRAWVRRPGHEVRLAPAEEALWADLRGALGGGVRFRPPRVRDLARALGQDEKMLRRLLRLVARRGELEEIAPDHFFLATAVIEMADSARALASADPAGQFTVIAFRDRLENGRKVAIHILEFFDRQGLTMRRGDNRRINPQKADLYLSPPAADPPVQDGGAASPVGRPDFKPGEGRETVLGRFDSYLLRQPLSGASPAGEPTGAPP